MARTWWAGGLGKKIFKKIECPMTTLSQSQANLQFGKSFIESDYSSNNSDSDSDNIAIPYLYEPEVEHILYLLWSLSMMKGFTTQVGVAKASTLLVFNLEQSLAF